MESKSITVGELIRELEEYDKNLTIYFFSYVNNSYILEWDGNNIIEMWVPDDESELYIEIA